MRERATRFHFRYIFTNLSGARVVALTVLPHDLVRAVEDKRYNDEKRQKIEASFDLNARTDLAYILFHQKNQISSEELRRFIATSVVCRVRYIVNINSLEFCAFHQISFLRRGLCLRRRAAGECFGRRARAEGLILPCDETERDNGSRQRKKKLEGRGIRPKD